MIVIRETLGPSLSVPLVLGAATVGGIWYLRHRNHERTSSHELSHSPLTTSANRSTPPFPAGTWVFPLPRWEGREPVISDGWGSPRISDARGTIHRGVDLMYRRLTLAELGDRFPPRTPHTRWHFMPPGTPVLAASDGDIWSAGWTPRGYTVVVSHGAPWATYYTHLSSLRVADTQRGSSKQRVRAGDPLGIVGADPKDRSGIAHLHFEMWFGGGADSAINPAPLLRRFDIRDTPSARPMTVTNVLPNFPSRTSP